MNRLTSSEVGEGRRSVSFFEWESVRETAILSSSSSGVQETVSIPSSSSGAQETKTLLFSPYVQGYVRRNSDVLQWESESETFDVLQWESESETFA